MTFLRREDATATGALERKNLCAVDPSDGTPAFKAHQLFAHAGASSARGAAKCIGESVHKNSSWHVDNSTHVSKL